MIVSVASGRIESNSGDFTFCAILAHVVTARFQLLFSPASSFFGSSVRTKQLLLHGRLFCVDLPLACSSSLCHYPLGGFEFLSLHESADKTIVGQLLGFGNSGSLTIASASQA